MNPPLVITRFEKKHYQWSDSANKNIPTPELNLTRNTYDKFSTT
jgi:hypothetical protein